jgi:hypothetical protein
MTSSGKSKKPEKTLSAYEGPDRIVASHTLKNQLASLPKPFKVRFKSRFFPSLNRICDGFAEGELYVVSGPTKAGKTLFAQSLTRALAANDVDCLWFSYEVPPRQFLDSFGDDLPKFFLPRQIHAQRIDWFEERTLESWEKYQSRVVFVDHLHFLFDMAKVKNPSLDIGAYVRRIKRFAVTHSLIVFLLTHITKVKPDEAISYSSIRDSSFIPQESDSVFLVRRLMDDKRRSELTVEFHRRTGALKERVHLVKAGQFLEEEVPF